MYCLVLWKSLNHWKHPIPNLQLLSLRWRLLHRLEGEIVRLQQKLGCYYEVVLYTKASTSSKPCCFNLNKSAEVVDIVDINCYVFVSILWGECLLGEFVYCLQNEINIRATSKGRINVKTLVFMAYLGTLSAYWLIDPCLGESQSQLWTPLAGINLVWRANSPFPMMFTGGCGCRSMWRSA